MNTHHQSLMKSNPFIWRVGVISIGMLTGAGLSSLVSPLLAQSNAANASANLSSVSFRSPPLSSRGAPGDRTGGGTRDGGNCPVVESSSPLTALVPLVNKDEANHVWSLTTQSSPTLWVYVPYSSAEAGTGHLAIWDETNPNPRTYRLMYDGEFTLANTPGVIGLSLPDHVVLDYEKSYHWYISMPLLCESDNTTIVISGWVERVSEQFPALFSSEMRDKIAIYAQQGIWQDAITLLAELRQNDPTNTLYLSELNCVRMIQQIRYTYLIGNNFCQMWIWHPWHTNP